MPLGVQYPCSVDHDDWIEEAPDLLDGGGEPLDVRVASVALVRRGLERVIDGQAREDERRAADWITKAGQHGAVVALDGRQEGSELRRVDPRGFGGEQAEGRGRGFFPADRGFAFGHGSRSDEGRQNLLGLAFDCDVHEAGGSSLVDVDSDRERAVPLGLVHQAGGGVDDGRGADREEDVARRFGGCGGDVPGSRDSPNQTTAGRTWRRSAGSAAAARRGTVASRQSGGPPRRDAPAHVPDRSVKAEEALGAGFSWRPSTFCVTSVKSGR